MYSNSEFLRKYFIIYNLEIQMSCLCWDLHSWDMQKYVIHMKSIDHYKNLHKVRLGLFFYRQVRNAYCILTWKSRFLTYQARICIYKNIGDLYRGYFKNQNRKFAIFTSDILILKLIWKFAPATICQMKKFSHV